MLRASGVRAIEIFTSTLLGATAARSRRFEEAAAAFQQAEQLSREVGDASRSMDVAVWSAESLVLQGLSDEALSLVEDVSASVSPTDPSVPLLLRVRGYAMAQKSEREASEGAFRGSLEVARSLGADHDVAFALDGLLRCRLSDGRPPEQMAAERDEIFQRLGIVAVPSVPLPDAV